MSSQAHQMHIHDAIRALTSAWDTAVTDENRKSVQEAIDAAERAFRCTTTTPGPSGNEAEPPKRFTYGERGICGSCTGTFPIGLLDVAVDDKNPRRGPSCPHCGHDLLRLAG